ncbi:MAG: sugar phosphate nucleotidyltransferase [Dehalococcoidia bacterium]
MGKIVALIMAGGQGKRMDVLCHLRPKPALPFAGKFNVIDFTLSNCVYSGIDDLAILTDYHRSHMATYLSEWGLSNAVRGFQILEPKAGSYKGTADAVFQNLPYLNKFNAQNVLILAGDHVYKMDYRGMLAFHEQTEADVTVGVIRVPIEEAHRFGTVSLGDDGEILEFVEKSSNPMSNLASMGIYIFNRDILAQRLAEDAVRPESPHDFGYAILPGMVGRDKVNAYEFTGYWQDIGTPRAYYTANMELVSAQPSLSLNDMETVLTRRLDLPPPIISQQGQVVNSLLSPGCVIKGHVENSILSPGVLIDERAEVWNSVLMPNVFVDHHSVVDTCIIDEKVNIGELSYIGFGNSLRARNDDITVLGKGVNVLSHTVVGRNCTVLPYVNTSTFRGNLIASGSILSQHGVTREPHTNEWVEGYERESIHVT